MSWPEAAGVVCFSANFIECDAMIRSVFSLMLVTLGV
jgi:hypothetical protein